MYYTTGDSPAQVKRMPSPDIEKVELSIFDKLHLSSLVFFEIENYIDHIIDRIKSNYVEISLCRMRISCKNDCFSCSGLKSGVRLLFERASTEKSRLLLKASGRKAGEQAGPGVCITNCTNLRSFGRGQWASGPLPTKIVLAGQRPTVLLSGAICYTHGPRPRWQHPRKNVTFVMLREAKM